MELMASYGVLTSAWKPGICTGKEHQGACYTDIALYGALCIM